MGLYDGSTERQNYEKYLDSNEEISSSLGDMLKGILK